MKNMTRKNMFILTVAADIAVYALYQLIKWILRLNGLALRNVPNYCVYAILVCITLFIIVQILAFLYRFAKQKQQKSGHRILAVAGMVAITALTLFTALFLTFFGIFRHEPEHVVEQDGKRMVAYVDSYLQVYVYYFDYVNPIVRGRYIKMEDYGNGGYDPFERDEMPTPKRTEVYGDD